jgi:hypothetical protein
MKTIWKFEVEPECIIEIPAGAQILSVGVQNNDVFMWVMVDPSAPTSRRKINVYGTGTQLPENPGVFIGTVMLYSGNFVGHVFDAGVV